MASVGLGDVLLRVSIGLTPEDMSHVSSATLLLRSPTGVVTELPVPPERLDKPGRMASAVHRLTVRGTYRLGIRVFFDNGLSLTGQQAITFTSTDGM
jgi:hypothetical protein